MKNDYVHRARRVSDLKTHLVLCTKYRRKALDNEMLTRKDSHLERVDGKMGGKTDRVQW